MKNRKNTYNFIILFLLLMLRGWPGLFAYELKDIPTPTHYVKGVPRFPLKIIKQLSPDFDQKLFFAQPAAITPGDQHRFYVYDKKLMTVFIFDGQYQCIGQFLRRGEGPGEALVNNNIDINSGLDGNIYLCDGAGDKIIQFSALGKYLADYRLHRSHFSILKYRPVVDKDGFLYTISSKNGLVDQYDRNKKLVIHTFLDIKEINNFVIYKGDTAEVIAKLGKTKAYMQPNFLNTFFDITNNGKLFIFLNQSSTMFLFNGQKLERKFSILIDSVLLTYKKNVEEMIQTHRQKAQKTPISFGYVMFITGFLDRDEPYFYLQQNGDNFSLFQFDFSGKLIAIIGGMGTEKIIKARLYAKKNGLFYGLSNEDGNPIILKKEALK